MNPRQKNTDLHPKAPSSRKTAAGANRAHTAAPLSKIPQPRVRSFGGRERSRTRRPAGQFEASATPRSKRNANKLLKPMASPVNPETRDHAVTAMAKHQRKLKRSSTGPTAN